MPRRRHVYVSLATFALVLAGVGVASAFSLSSPNYRLDDGTLNSFGGPGSSPNYGLTASGGEAFIGPGSSTNYKINQGYVASLEQSIALSLDSLNVTIPQVTPGTSQTATSQVAVTTDAAGYLLGARQDRLLTHDNGSTTIPNVSGTVFTPALWTEGTTVGFGFTLLSGSGLDAKWGSNPNYKYAFFPTDATTVHDKPNYQNTADTTTVQYRLGVSNTQLPGRYRNSVTYTATVKP